MTDDIKDIFTPRKEIRHISREDYNDIIETVKRRDIQISSNFAMDVFIETETNDNFPAYVGQTTVAMYVAPWLSNDSRYDRFGWERMIFFLHCEVFDDNGRLTEKAKKRITDKLNLVMLEKNISDDEEEDMDFEEED